VTRSPSNNKNGHDDHSKEEPAMVQHPRAGHPALPAAAPVPRLRGLLLALGACSAGAAGAAAAPVVEACVAQATAPTPPASSGYRETEHVRDYYDSTRI
jgi:hypothetical protein